MAERNSEYERVPGDTYVTPPWVYEALADVEPWAVAAWDCAPVEAKFDFLKVEEIEPLAYIATNPPYKDKMPEKFIRHALHLTRQHEGKVAMLLPMAYDCGKTRRDLFENHPFKAKYTLTRRICWMNLSQVGSPSQNHAWFVWDWQCASNKAFMGWLPRGSSYAT